MTNTGYAVAEVETALGTAHYTRYRVLTPTGHTVAEYARRADAELHAELASRIPPTFIIERCAHRANTMRRGHYWMITGQLPGDPTLFRAIWDCNTTADDTAAVAAARAGLLTRNLEAHIAGSPARIAKAAEAAAVAAAEATVQEARAAQLADAAARRGPLATERQVAYILTLLEKRRRSGEGGGFFAGPTDQAGLELLTRAEASAYINSLTSNY